MSTPATLRATGIVVALASEARALTSRTTQPERITVLAGGSALCLSGMGLSAARRAAQMLVEAGAPALAVFGVAGALSPNLRNGTLFCPERVLDEEGHQRDTDPAWRASLRKQLTLPVRTEGALLSVAAPLLTGMAKTTAHQRCGALAVDMESAAVAAVAAEHGLPFLVLRAIVDESDDAIPEALNGSVDAWGRPRTLNLIAALGRHPSLWGELPRLYSRMQKATQALRAVTAAAGPSLGWHR
ncbi:purine and other phosphorylase-like protein, family 1 [Dyella choica]|uniref:phosphorylase family protein n=1 Tax=Dyella choica TaxID=1927959 RepID=UPI001E4B8591|nr:purine and other phosphorylase-like protein, family 1 [Dyella choica]